mmetsp:Transcript_1254/g.3374  ORF Transcript_1254/g.3374 Transcript_1254/m.3374 type:complete len:81 (-) Transcript_1254:79-321(-)
MDLSQSGSQNNCKVMLSPDYIRLPFVGENDACDDNYLHEQNEPTAPTSPISQATGPIGIKLTNLANSESQIHQIHYFRFR